MSIINIKYTFKDIDLKRKQVYEKFLKQSTNITGKISTISIADLRNIFELYDNIFLNDWFQNHFRGKLKFSLSRRMTKSAGLTLCPKNISSLKLENVILEIRISVDFLFQYNLIDGKKKVCGILTEDSLQALQLILEHELCHAIEFLYFHKSSCIGERFKTIAMNLFGHNESYHKLPTNKQIASQKLGLKVGDNVSFEFEGRKIIGFIYNINKRGTIMVKNPKGTLVDKNGNRYVKYYVPLSELRLIDKGAV